MLEVDSVCDNLFGDASDPEVRFECDLAWSIMSPHERAVALDAAFILDAQPIAGTMMRDAYDKMVGHTKAALAHRILSTALDFDQKTRARIVGELERLRGELRKTEDVWERASALTDVLVGDRA